MRFICYQEYLYFSLVPSLPRGEKISYLGFENVAIVPFCLTKRELFGQSVGYIHKVTIVRPGGGGGRETFLRLEGTCIVRETCHCRLPFPLVWVALAFSLNLSVSPLIFTG